VENLEMWARSWKGSHEVVFILWCGVVKGEVHAEMRRNQSWR
jgi:hypothetical protein